jgi:hypothetical protein
MVDIIIYDQIILANRFHEMGSTSAWSYIAAGSRNIYLGYKTVMIAPPQIYGYKVHDTASWHRIPS